MRWAGTLAAERPFRDTAQMEQRALELGQGGIVVKPIAADDLGAMHDGVSQLAYRHRPALFAEQLAGSRSNGIQIVTHFSIPLHQDWLLVHFVFNPMS
jgi:hypothetical protein